MDRFTRNAVIATAVLTLALILSVTSWSEMRLGPRIWQLNAILAQDPTLEESPYPFKAVLFLNGIVTLTRPYDEQVSLTEALTAMDPTLSGKPADDPAVIAARDRLQGYEMYAIGLMLSQQDVRSVVWSLDRAWVNEQGIALPPPAPLSPM
jgi:hypothetical protein